MLYPKVLLDAWARFGWEHWAALQQARSHPDRADGGGQFAWMMIVMTADGVSSLLSQGCLRRTSPGCWRLYTELVPRQHDGQERLLYTCSMVASPEPQILPPQNRTITSGYVFYYVTELEAMETMRIQRRLPMEPAVAASSEQYWGLRQAHIVQKTPIEASLMLT